MDRKDNRAKNNDKDVIAFGVIESLVRRKEVGYAILYKSNIT